MREKLEISLKLTKIIKTRTLLKQPDYYNHSLLNIFKQKTQVET